ncbi:mannitol dehydrogenase family protein [Sphingobium bisphenolivorans]|uniref:mannitol dehydrogenase family protein n=1 Tax=Sphingobium bisphenolivorans TaxID=1335760 RepID=UPI0003A3251F|nr:mannitol dehydrogenase family protein [Sphingobium bisphenolivorans]
MPDLDLPNPLDPASGEKAAPRLSTATIPFLALEVKRPAYNRSGVANGVLHFGPGAFHRAHQAAAFDALLAHDPRWGITGVSLHSTQVAQALNPQDGLYSLALLDEEPGLQIIGSLTRILTGSQGKAVMEAMTSPELRIISSTVTEKGYCLGPDGRLDEQHPDIRSDLADLSSPRSFIGWLASGLAERRRRGLPGATILSCDNLTDNGRKLGAAVIDFASMRDPDTARWIEDHVRFPNAMVDSITPATDQDLRRKVAQSLGLTDAWPIQRERFTQWVIEDDFVDERPALDVAGVTFTKDVHPFEAAKLRLLNGAHSTLAYVGLLRGHRTVAQAMTDEWLARFVERLMREDIVPTLKPPAGLDLDIYISDVLRRFRNPAIEHLLSQIAWDGSQKLPYRLLGTIRDRLASGGEIQRLILPIAAWLRFIAHAARHDLTITDPLADRLLAAGDDWQAIVAMPEIFGDLAGSPVLVQPLTSSFKTLDDLRSAT